MPALIVQSMRYQNKDHLQSFRRCRLQVCQHSLFKLHSESSSVVVAVMVLVRVALMIIMHGQGGNNGHGHRSGW